MSFKSLSGSRNDLDPHPRPLAVAPVIEYLCNPEATELLGARAARCYLRRRAANWFNVSTATEKPIAA